MASGTPLVAFANPGFQTVIDDREDGILVPPRDCNGLASAIVVLFQDRELRQRLRANGLQKALHFSWKNVARDLEEFYLITLDKVSKK
jgi:glycosyltransferase involved in cell wall biosynthesis